MQLPVKGTKAGAGRRLPDLPGFDPQPGHQDRIKRSLPDLLASDPQPRYQDRIKRSLLNLLASDPQPGHQSQHWTATTDRTRTIPRRCYTRVHARAPPGCNPYGVAFIAHTHSRSRDVAPSPAITRNASLYNTT